MSAYALPFTRARAAALLSAALLSASAGSVLAQGAADFREPRVYQVQPGDWQGARLPDGQPDVQGHWSNTIGNHNHITDPQGDFPFDEEGRPVPAKPDREARAPSRLAVPADGQFPFQDWARAKQLEFAAHLLNPTRPEYVEPLARCAPGGPTKSLLWHGFEIRQYPNYVLMLFDSGTRLIHLDGKPALHENVQLWNGDSRGHWEGNTLVVEVRNHNGKARFGRSGEFVSAKAQVQERFIFEEGGERFLYQGSYTDPTVLSAPIRFDVPLRRITAASAVDGWNNVTFPVNFASPDAAPDIEAYERTCAENNGNHGGVAAH